MIIYNHVQYLHYVIYKATNKNNNKSYIGFTKNYEERKNQHNTMRSKNRKFHNALRKYGIQNFEWEILYQSNDGDYCLSIAEPYFIRLYESFGSGGYNMNLGGIGQVGISDETRKRISNSLLGNTPWNKGKPASEKTKKLWSEQRKGRVPWNKGLKCKNLTEEHKRKISQGTKNKPGVNKGKKWYINILTGQTKFMFENDASSEWIKGRVIRR